ncbi:hypothetical protein, partial [Leucobacter albus]
NALLEEMRKIAEDETVRVLESAGLISQRLHVIGVSGVHSKYVAKPAEDRAARALAEAAKAAAEEALEAVEAAGVARKESLSGCRSNSANDTRTGSLRDSLSGRLDRGRVVIFDGDGDMRADHEVNGPFCRCDSENPHALLGSKSFADAADGVVEVVLRLNVGVTAVVDANGHVSSPVVAESEAATSDAPAMTVQEGGSSDAAPGVEGVSPASSAPRFVVLGELVYDREANKAVSCTNSSAAQSVAAELNAHHGNHNRFYWEDAK